MLVAIGLVALIICGGSPFATTRGRPVEKDVELFREKAATQV
ncbi:MAG: hypothetical protein ACI9X4_000870 [Glaciecola sp.]|jgi:hypothetical protein